MKRPRAKRSPAVTSAADLAARHEAVRIVNARPDLWPLLNAATLSTGAGPADWPAALRQLRAAAPQPEIADAIAA